MDQIDFVYLKLTSALKWQEKERLSTKRWLSGSRKTANRQLKPNK